jgi:hypothetical protein
MTANCPHYVRKMGAKVILLATFTATPRSTSQKRMVSSSLIRFFTSNLPGP